MEVYQITQGMCVHQDRLRYCQNLVALSNRSPVLIHHSCWLWVCSSLLSFSYWGCLNSCLNSWLKGGQVGSGGRELWGVSHKQESALVPPAHSRLVKAYHKVLQARSAVLLYAGEVGRQKYVMSGTQNYQTVWGEKQIEYTQNTLDCFSLSFAFPLPSPMPALFFKSNFSVWSSLISLNVCAPSSCLLFPSNFHFHLNIAFYQFNRCDIYWWHALPSIFSGTIIRTSKLLSASLTF